MAKRSAGYFEMPGTPVFTPNRLFQTDKLPYLNTTTVQCSEVYIFVDVAVLLRLIFHVNFPEKKYEI